MKRLPETQKKRAQKTSAQAERKGHSYAVVQN